MRPAPELRAPSPAHRTRRTLGVAAALGALCCGGGAAPLAASADEPPTATTGQDGPGSDEPAADGRFDQSHAAWTRVLAAHVRGDRFDYAALKKDTAELDAYLATLAAVAPGDLAAWQPHERLAFFINAYNAHVVSLIVGAYPLDSINDLSTEKLPIWKRKFIPLGAHLEGAGEQLSLDQLEHELIRERFRDARIHVGVNCASASCPPLRAEAYRGEILDRQLNEQLTAFLADGDLNQFDPITRTARISKLFEWFAADFERETGSVQGFLARHGPSQHRIWLQSARLEYLEYDWSLNAVPRETGR